MHFVCISYAFLCAATLFLRANLIYSFSPQAVRPKSLFELHQEGLKKSKSTGTSNEVKEKDFLASGWDRSEMEQGRGAMNPKEAKKMLADAAGLDGRFGSRTFQ